MVEATQKIAKGNYDIQISAHSSDELGRLTDEFNSMAQKLRGFHDLNVEQIMAEKQKSEAIIRSIDDGIILVDAEFKVTGVNPMARRILDDPPEELQNRHFLEVVKSEELFNYIKQSMESGKPPSIEERENVFTVEREGNPIPLPVLNHTCSWEEGRFDRGGASIARCYTADRVRPSEE